ncbi:hypothetical protein ACJX0J_031169, partial [Zea mays]
MKNKLDGSFQRSNLRTPLSNPIDAKTKVKRSDSDKMNAGVHGNAGASAGGKMENKTLSAKKEVGFPNMNTKQKKVAPKLKGDVMGYHLLTLVCHCLILTLAILFLWSSAMVFINKCPNIPEVKIPNDLTLNVARSLRYEINMGFATLWVIGQDHELKKFLIVVAGLWILSVHGSCCNFLTLSYI